MSFLPSRAICVLAPSFVFALLLCGGCGTGQPDEPPLPGGIDLPEVGTLGRAPRGDATIVVNVTGDGEITVGGKGPLSLVGLRDELTRLTKPARWREADRTSRKILLVNADASLPWPVSVWLMQVAAEPGIELYRVFFGARTADRVGAVGWTLPTSTRGIVDGPAPATLYLAIRAHDGKKATPETLLPALSVLAAQAGDEPLMLDIRVPPPGQGAIRTGFVIQVVDMALRAGVSRLRFQGMPPPVPKETREDVDAFLRHVQRLKEEAGVPSLWVAGTTLKGPLPSTPTPPSRGRLSYLYGAEVAKTEPRPEKPDEPPAPEEDVEFLADKEIEPYRLDEPGPTVEFTRPSPWYARDDRSAFPGRRRRSEDAREEAVEAALLWLAAHQSPNGGWEAAGFPAWCRGAPESLRAPPPRVGATRRTTSG